MKTYKIPLILTFIYTGILFISIVVLATLQTNTKPHLPNPDSVQIFNKSSKASKTYEKNSTEYAEILGIYNECFEKTFLAQLADDNIIDENIKEDITAEPWTDYNKDKNIYLALNYELPKKFIIYRDGSSRQVDIKTLYIPITKLNKTRLTYVYYDVEKSESSEENKTTSNTLYPLIVEANTYELYEYIKEQL